MNDGTNVFATMLGGFQATTPNREAPRKSARVTAGTIAKVRQDQAIEAAKRSVQEELSGEIAALRTERDALKGELDAVREDAAAGQIVIAQFAAEKADLAGQLADVRAERKALNAENAELSETIRRLRLENESLAKARAALEEELAEERARPRMDESLLADLRAKAEEAEQLKAMLGEARQTSLSTSVLLGKPYQPVERFAGEIREHVLAALKDSCEAASSGGRDRRATILEAVLMENQPTGELETRRAAVKDILAGVEGRIDERTIAELEKLGFRHVSQSNHHKLRWGNVIFTMAKTPSDRRSVKNAANDLANKVF